MRYLILDVETLPDPTVLPLLDAVEPDAKLLEPIEPDSRLKDPVKIAANREDVLRRIANREAEIIESIRAKTEARDEKLALKADCCQIAMLGTYMVGGSDPKCYSCHSEDDERTALTLFWAAYASAPGGTAIVSFYGFKFDLPVLMRRSQLLGVPCPTLELTPWKTPHIDLYDKLTFGGKIEGHSLKFYCRRFGIPIEDPVDGKDVGTLWAEGNYEAVKAHCESDIASTHALANRLGLLRLT